MKSGKYIALFVLLVLGLGGGAMLRGQNTLIPSVSNYHLTWTSMNPAFTGFRDVISLSSLYRSPLYGGAGPTDMQLNVHTPLQNSKTAVGAVIAYNSTPPNLGMYSLMGTYAYRMYLSSGRLALGLSAGLYGVNSQDYPYENYHHDDPSFTEEAYRRWIPNFGFGILYSEELFFIGFSIPELLSIPSGADDGLKANPANYSYLLSGAYEFRFSDNFSLKPSAVVDVSKSSTTFKASLNAGFLNRKFFIGGAYDHPTYAIALLNYQINPQLLIGYAYTIGISDVRTYLGGAHEVVLRWELVKIIKTYEEDPFYF